MAVDEDGTAAFLTKIDGFPSEYVNNDDGAEKI